jgi:D-lyxose ketol-isomerase
LHHRFRTDFVTDFRFDFRFPPISEPFIAHAFWAEGGAAVAGEVSLANNDATDNYFLPPLAPFAPIEEDAPARDMTVRDHGRR